MAQKLDLPLGFPESIKNMRNAKKNLEQADRLFSQLASNSNFNPMIDHFLYFRALESSSGISVESPKKVKIDFNIFDPTGKCLSMESGAVIELLKTIPGFVHGVNKMKIMRLVKF